MTRVVIPLKSPVRQAGSGVFPVTTTLRRLARPFIAAEEECLVLDDRSAHISAEIVINAKRRRRGEEVARIQFAAVVIPERAAVIAGSCRIW